MVATPLDSELQERLARRVAEAERRTRAEFVTVVARRASRPGPELALAAALLALALAGLLWASGLVRDFPRLYLLQAGIMLLAALAYLWPPASLALQPRTRRRAAVRALAEASFTRLGLHRTGTRGGVLLFVALAERQVEILADEAATLALPEDTWSRAVEIFTRELGQGDLDGGFAVTLNFLAERLAQALPRLPGDQNELADRLVVL